MQTELPAQVETALDAVLQQSLPQTVALCMASYGQTGQPRHRNRVTRQAPPVGGLQLGQAQMRSRKAVGAEDASWFCVLYQYVGGGDPVTMMLGGLLAQI